MLSQAAVETMHALYHRTPFSDDDVSRLVCPLLTSSGIDMLASIFASSAVDHENIDETKYIMLKKLSEVRA